MPLGIKENVQNQLVKVSSEPEMNFAVLSKLLSSSSNKGSLKSFLSNAGHPTYYFNPMKAIEYGEHKSNGNVIDRVVIMSSKIIEGEQADFDR